MKKNWNNNRVFYVVNMVFLVLCFLIVALPIVNVIASSLSTPNAVVRGRYLSGP